MNTLSETQCGTLVSVNEEQFLELLSRQPPSEQDRRAYADLLESHGRSDEAAFIRHRAEMMLVAGETQHYLHNSCAAKSLTKKLDPAWLRFFEADLTRYEKLRIEADPVWEGSVAESSDMATLQIADGVSIGFELSCTWDIATHALLRRMDLPLEYLISGTVVIWHDELSDWKPIKGMDRLYLCDECEGRWAKWFYARPETWTHISEATDGEVPFDGMPALMALDADRILLTNLADPIGLKQMAQYAHQVLEGKTPVTFRPLRHDQERTWSYLPDTENESAEVWLELFGPSPHRTIESRNLRSHADVILDPVEREAAQHLIHHAPSASKLDILHLSGSAGDWRTGEPVRSVRISRLKSLPHLAELHVQGGGLPEKWWTALAKSELPSLRSMMLQRCRVSSQDLQQLHTLPALLALHLVDLKNNQPVVPELPNLMELKLAGKHVDHQTIQPIAGSAVEYLDLSGCGNITDEAMKVIGTLDSLRCLNLHETSVSNSGVAELTRIHNLEYVDLRKTSVTSDAAFSFVEMKSLTLLRGFGSDVIETLMEELPNLSKMNPFL